MAWARIAAVTGSGQNGFTTSPGIDTSGADLIVIVGGWYSGSTDIVITDNKTQPNGWTGKTAQVTGTPTKGRIFYSWNAGVGTGHTFTVTGGSTFASICVVAFSGSQTSSDPFSDENGATNPSAISLATGSAGAADRLAVAGLGGSGSADAKSIDLSFVLDGDVPFTGGTNYSSALAYKFQTGADNPTWSWTTIAEANAVIASFLAAPSGPAALPFVMQLGAQRI